MCLHTLPSSSLVRQSFTGNWLWRTSIWWLWRSFCSKSRSSASVSVNHTNFSLSAWKTSGGYLISLHISACMHIARFISHSHSHALILNYLHMHITHTLIRTHTHFHSHSHSFTHNHTRIPYTSIIHDLAPASPYYCSFWLLKQAIIKRGKCDRQNNTKGENKYIHK